METTWLQLAPVFFFFFKALFPKMVSAVTLKFGYLIGFCFYEICGNLKNGLKQHGRNTRVQFVIMQTGV